LYEYICGHQERGDILSMTEQVKPRAHSELRNACAKRRFFAPAAGNDDMRMWWQVR
jgi:hypothetical protein